MSPHHTPRTKWEHTVGPMAGAISMKRRARHVVCESAPEAVYHLPLGLTKKQRLSRSLEYWCSIHDVCMYPMKKLFDASKIKFANIVRVAFKFTSRSCSSLNYIYLHRTQDM